MDLKECSSVVCLEFHERYLLTACFDIVTLLRTNLDNHSCKRRADRARVAGRTLAVHRLDSRALVFNQDAARFRIELKENLAETGVLVDCADCQQLNDEHCG